MPQSLSLVLVHIVFSTKDRVPLLSPEVAPRLHRYLATVSRGMSCDCYAAGGVADHVHLAVTLGRTVSMAKLIEEVKTSSSMWLKADSPRLKDFAWQRGYGAFSVAYDNRGALIEYINNQEVHHQKLTFKEEYMQFLRENGIEPDPRYMWD